MNLIERLNETPAPKSTVGGPSRTRAYAYLRVSHEDSAERGTSIETQRQDITTYAQRNNIEILQWFEEPGKSAFKLNSQRTIFARMISQAKLDPSVNTILVWKSDRFSRGQYEASAIKHELLKYGVRVISIVDNYDPTTAAGVVVEKVSEAMNTVRSMELSVVSHKNLTTNAQLRDAETGWAHKNGGRPLWGYRNVRMFTDKHAKYQRKGHCIWLLDDEEVNGLQIHEWARTMLIDWRLGEGLGYDRIAQRLTQVGVSTPSGLPAWTHSTIYYLLTWDKVLEYAGYGIWNKAEYASGGKRDRHPSEWVVVDKAHPAIITLEEAERIEAMASRAPRGSYNRSRGRWLMTGGIVVCGDCGTRFAGKTVNKIDYYVCGAHLYRAGAGCVSPAWSLRRVDLEDLVTRAIVEHLPRDKKTARALASAYNRAIDEEARLVRETEQDRIKAVDDYRQQVRRLTDMVARGVDSPEIQDEIALRIGQINRLEELSDYEPPARVTPERILDVVRDAVKASRGEDQELRREVIRTHVERLTIYQKKREAVLTFKDGFTSELSENTGGANAPRIPRYTSRSIKAVGRALGLVPTQESA